VVRVSESLKETNADSHKESATFFPVKKAYSRVGLFCCFLHQVK
jgi:hypothetical protein